MMNRRVGHVRVCEGLCFFNTLLSRHGILRQRVTFVMDSDRSIIFVRVIVVDGVFACERPRREFLLFEIARDVSLHEDQNGEEPLRGFVQQDVLVHLQGRENPGGHLVVAEMVGHHRPP